MHKLTDNEFSNRLDSLDNWKLRQQRIEKDFKFVDFKAAIAFINRLAATAEALNHHPDWSNSYNKVHISLTSHAAGGLTDKDFLFALAANKAAK